MHAVVSPGRDVPDDINVIVEVPANGSQVKYEVDKQSGLLMVDRFMPTAMHYPCDYGYIPSTLAEDKDPIDVLVITPFMVQPACLIRCRVLGMLCMEDENGLDHKILAVPIKKACRQYEHIESLDDVPLSLMNSIVHFFEHYKGLEPEKWVKLEGWMNKEAASATIQKAIERYQEQEDAASLL